MPIRKSVQATRRHILNAIGWASVVLGVLGIFLPLLPTTPFLLLAAACFVRSSPRFYQWLVEHPRLGRYIIHYLEGKGIPRRAKWVAITMIWITISTSALIFVQILWLRILLFTIATCVTIYILRQPTLASDTPLDDEGNATLDRLDEKTVER